MINKAYRLLKKQKFFLLLTLILIGMSVFLYRQYIFGHKLFIFEDYGSDSIRVSVPTYLYFFDWFRTGMPLWSDKMGIGTSILSHGEILFDPFTYILFLFGRNAIMNMFIYMVVSKIVLSGIFFWFFIGKYEQNKLSIYAKLLGAITYAFGGYIIITGQNYVFGTIYVYVPLLLLGFEVWFQDKKKRLLTLTLTAIALYFFYFFYMAAIFLGIYAIFRYFAAFQFNTKRFATYLLSLIGCGIIALGLAAFYWIPVITLTMNNLRLGAAHPSFFEMVLPTSQVIATILGRLFSSDILGSPMNFLGFRQDYFQLALFCSLFTLIIFPHVFQEKEKRKKRAYIGFSIILLLLLIIPFASYVFNAFSDFTYRWAFVIQFSFSLFLAIALDTIYTKKIFSYKNLLATSICLIVAAAYVIFFIHQASHNVRIERAIKIIGIDFGIIGLYIVLLITSFKTKYQKSIKIVIFFLVCLELLIFNRHFIDDRFTTPADSVTNKRGYFDSTNDAIKYLHKTDNTIYRIDKSYNSVVSEYGKTPSDNDAMAQEYRGLKSYNSNNQPNYIRFLHSLGVFVKYPAYAPPKNMKPEDLRDANLNYINGVGDRFLLQSFLGVKYYLTKTDQSNLKLPPYYSYLTTINNINIYKNENYLPISFLLDKYITKKDFLSLDNQTKDRILLSSLVIGKNTLLPDAITKTEIAKVNTNMYQEYISHAIKEKRDKSLQIYSYKDDHFKGRITVQKASILLLSIPYDKGWSAYANGKKVNTVKVDIGLLGVPLSSGEQMVELLYFPTNMRIGILITLGTLIALLLISIYKKKITKRIDWVISSTGVLYNRYQRNPKVAGILVTIRIMMQKITKLITVLELDKKRLTFYLVMIGAILLDFLSGIVTRGSTFYNLFQTNQKDTFMDFYSPLSELKDGPYAHGSIYPPLPLLLYKWTLRLIPYNIVIHGANAIKASQIGQMLFLLYILLSFAVFFLLIIEIKKGKNIEKYIFGLLMLLSGPFLFELERGNNILVAFLFLMIFAFFKDSKNKIIHEIALLCLALSAAIKLYPIIFCIVLLKEKKWQEVIRVLVYAVGFFILPFFALGGVRQIVILCKNIFTTTNGVIDWGVGNSVNMQSMVRIVGALMGDFGNTPLLISKIVSPLILVMGVLSVFFIRSKWKTMALLSLLMIMVPPLSFEYTLLFMVIPLVMFLDSEEKEKKNQIIYLVCFILIFIPFPLGKVDEINNGFGKHTRPLTYGVLIQNIALFVMLFSFMMEGVRDWRKKRITN